MPVFSQSAVLAAASTVAVAEDPKPLDLPPPRSEGGMPLMAIYVAMADGVWLY